MGNQEVLYGAGPSNIYFPVYMKLNLHYITRFAISLFSLCWGIGYPESIRVPSYVIASLSALVLVIARMGKVGNLLLPGQVLILAPILTFLSLLWENLAGSLYMIAIILLFVLIVYACPFGHGSTSLSWMYHSQVCAIVLTLLVLLYQILFLGTLRPSALFPEPSHLGYSLGPPLGMLLEKKGYRAFAFLSLLLTLKLSFSITLVFGVLCFPIVALIWKIKKPIVFAASYLSMFSMATLIFLMLSSATPAFGLDLSDSGSLQIYTIKFLDALDKTLFSGHFLGLGPFGWLQSGYQEDISLRGLESYNQRDLASMPAFLLGAFGLISPLLIFLLALHAKNSSDLTFRGHLNKNISDSLAILVLSFALVHSIRWAGIMLSPLLAYAALYFSLISRKRVTLGSAPMND